MRPFLQFNLVFFYFVLGCSGVDYIDDYIPPTVRILNPVQSLTIGSEFQFEARYFNVIGEPTNEVGVFLGKFRSKSSGNYRFRESNAKKGRYSFNYNKSEL